MSDFEDFDQAEDFAQDDAPATEKEKKQADARRALGITSEGSRRGLWGGVAVAALLAVGGAYFFMLRPAAQEAADSAAAPMAMQEAAPAEGNMNADVAQNDALPPVNEAAPAPLPDEMPAVAQPAPQEAPAEANEMPAPVAAAPATPENGMPPIVNDQPPSSDQLATTHEQPATGPGAAMMPAPLEDKPVAANTGHGEPMPAAPVAAVDKVAPAEEPAKTPDDSARVKELEQKIVELEKTIHDLQATAKESAADTAQAIAEEKPVAVKKKTVRKTSSAAQKTTAAKWVLKAAKPGMAWVAPQGSSQLRMVTPGESLPGIGKITSIVKTSSGHWEVNGTRGRIGQ